MANTRDDMGLSSLLNARDELFRELDQEEALDKERVYNEREQAAIDEIAHRCDGPVTAFVAIARAIDLAREGKHLPVGIDDPIANALAEVLETIRCEGTLSGWGS